MTCPVCCGTNLLHAKIESNIPLNILQAFECLYCQTQFSILKPQILEFEVSCEESREERQKKIKRRRNLAEILDGILLGWLLRK
ncbi:MAG: hypothetical protein QXF45_04935 [Candidatus Caldarchaeum sp.]